MGGDRGLLDICTQFGPMASMHAALDAEGCGMPCAISATYEQVTALELEQHLLSVTAQFPVLNARLRWVDGRPVLKSTTGVAIADAAPLDFSALAAPLTWQAVVRDTDHGARLTAVFSHAVSDGVSMLGLVAEIERRLGRNDQRIWSERIASTRRPAALPWLSGFLTERARPHVVLAPDSMAPMGASWFRTTPEVRDQILSHARSSCGRVMPYLAAAAALTTADFSVGPRRRVSLNIPISRVGRQSFGFGAGSLLLGQEVPAAADTDSLSRRLAPKLAHAAASGWDRRLDWFIGQQPARHRKFARLRARGAADPTINVSWKGFDRQLGGVKGARDVACFAASPTAHISAHADLNGLSISLTAPRSQTLREDFLRGLAGRLGIKGEVSLQTYAA